ncbi:MAG: hypothetical protein IJP90_13890, partial [Treponema sp.]|nr:hypothetical protein [Treponema sp.]
MNLRKSKIRILFEQYPEIKKYFDQISIPVISENMTLEELFSSLSEQWFRDSGLSEEIILKILESIANENKICDEPFKKIETLTILGGKNKFGENEKLFLELKAGDVLGITGLTGSGKTQFLEDVEYVASGDSPSRRKILINGQLPSESEREILENFLCSSLSQSRNFIMELSCKDFIWLHA